MVERIKKIMEKEGSNPSAFADIIGISRSSMNHILNGRNNPSLDVLMKILSAYQTINSEWLLFGKLPMHKGEKSFLQPSLFDETPVNQPEVPKEIEYRKEIKVQQPEIEPQSIKKEEVIIQNPTSRKIDKIMIFYSDQTFETFAPENNLIRRALD